MTAPVLFDVDERGVATVTLNRPERLNAINLEMRDLLWEYVRAVRDMGTVRALVFAGAGPSFSAGADIAEFGTAPGLIAARRARHDRDIWWELLRLELPTIARMHGFCYGAGLELPLCCDVRIAEEGSVFALPEVRLGYMPSAGGTQTLPRTVPPGVAAHMILTGAPIDSYAALGTGLVGQVVERDSLDGAIAEAVEEALRDPGGVMARRLAMARS